MLMTTDPGDLVLDPTCGSGTTAYVAEQWGRRWITIDTSRVPLALARQRLLTATFPYYELKDEARGPAGGFVYKRKQNKQGRGSRRHRPARHAQVASPTTSRPTRKCWSTGPRWTSKHHARHRPVLRSRRRSRRRWIGTSDGIEDTGGEPARASYGSFVDRMLEVLRASPVLHAGRRQDRHAARTSARRPRRCRSRPRRWCATATAAPTWTTWTRPRQTASCRSRQAGGHRLRPGERRGEREAGLRGGAARRTPRATRHLYVIGFAIQPNARELVEKCEAAIGRARHLRPGHART